MAKFVKGDVVVVPFPFSDLTVSKRRPALVLARATATDFILAQITSRNMVDGLAVAIETADFAEGGLNTASNVRPNKLFTAESGLILYKAGSLTPEKTDEVTTAVSTLLQSGDYRMR